MDTSVGDVKSTRVPIIVFQFASSVHQDDDSRMCASFNDVQSPSSKHVRRIINVMLSHPIA